MEDLGRKAEEFAAILTQVVNGTVTTGVSFVVTPFANNPALAWAYPEGSTPASPILVPITCPEHNSEGVLKRSAQAAPQASHTA
jgi:hypothetical protein